MMNIDLASTETKDRLLREDIDDNELTTPKTIQISTKYGYVIVTQQGLPNRSVLVTYHDIAYNSATQFHHFFSIPEMMPVTEHFTIYHINAPGQEDQANALPTASIYPDLDQLAETVNDVFDYLNIKSAIGLGVGLGANVLVRTALKYPNKFYGLILVNCITRGVGWLEGFSLKWPTKDIPEQRWTSSLLNYLIWYHLGSESQSSQPDLVAALRDHLENNINVKNAIKLLNAFLKRIAIPLKRSPDGNKHGNAALTLKCSVVNITGFSSPHKEDVIDTHDRCDPATSSYVEFSDCGGAILEEQPAKMAETIRLFLQGLGYISHLSIPRYSIANRLAEQTAEYKRRHGSFSKPPRRVSTQIDSGHYVEDEPTEYEEELQLRVDSFDRPQV
ncbi:unnamed protein product [Adineta ricciae]|uniref:Uncharacterized protein n=1 Tax=Adineta ricciae TaxID=249248 RepID=A0A814EKX2_ADIRI|nr:unnamed protein product [Adineta ricciae]CAF1161938.1 unnamed protein product [Adineta ricciae]